MDQQVKDLLAKALMSYKSEVSGSEEAASNLATIDQAAVYCGAADSRFYSVETNSSPSTRSQYRLEFRMTAETEGFDDEEYEERLMLTPAEYERISVFLQRLLELEAIAPINPEAEITFHELLYRETPDNEVQTFGDLMKSWADPGYLFELGKQFDVSF